MKGRYVITKKYFCRFFVHTRNDLREATLVLSLNFELSISEYKFR